MPAAQEKITLYTNHICPYAHRVHTALAELGLEFEEVTIDLSKPREQWYLDINPRGQVPAIKYGDAIIGESSIIVEFLYDAFGPAAPADRTAAALSKARQHYFVDTFAAKVTPHWGQLIFSPAPAGSAERAELGRKLLSAIETDLAPQLRGAEPFFGGAPQPTLAEVNLGSFLLRLDAFSRAEGDAALIPASTGAGIKRALGGEDGWWGRVVSRPSVTGIWNEQEVITRTTERRRQRFGAK